MSQDRFAHTMPLFGSAGRHSYGVFPSAVAGRFRHPSIVALGASCGVQQRTADGTASSHVSASTPSVNGCGKSGDAAATTHRHALSAGVSGQRRPNEPRRDGHSSSGWRPSPRAWSVSASQLLAEEEITRWRLRCEEQEDRVEIALSRPFCRVHVAPQHNTTVTRVTHARGGVHDGEETHFQSRTPPAEPAELFSGAAVSLRHVERRAKTRKHRTAELIRGLPESSPGDVQCPAAAATHLYVRDSELLRALQRAESRIKELEACTPLPPAPPPSKEWHASYTRTHALAAPPASATSSLPHRYAALSPHLEIV